MTIYGDAGLALDCIIAFEAIDFGQLGLEFFDAKYGSSI